MGISPDLADYLVKNIQEISFIRQGSKEKVLQLSISRADALKNEKVSNFLTEMHSWFTMNASGYVSASLETDKYSNIFPYQFYGSVNFDGADPTNQFYVFQFTYTPKIINTTVKVERKTLWKKIRSMISGINQRT
jgi:hypothetical protein